MFCECFAIHLSFEFRCKCEHKVWIGWGEWIKRKCDKKVIRLAINICASNSWKTKEEHRKYRFMWGGGELESTGLKGASSSWERLRETLIRSFIVGTHFERINSFSHIGRIWRTDYIWRWWKIRNMKTTKMGFRGRAIQIFYPTRI